MRRYQFGYICILSAFFLFYYSSRAFSQKQDTLPATNYFLFDFGGGSSSFTGYSLFSSFSVERKNQRLTLKWNLNNEIGFREVSLFVYKRYNERLRLISLLYGRTYRRGPFILSASLGAGFCKYQTKAPANWTHAIKRKIVFAPSFDFQANALVCTDENFGLGLLFFGSANPYRSVWGAGVTFAWGILKDE